MGGRDGKEDPLEKMHCFMYTCKERMREKQLGNFSFQMQEKFLNYFFPFCSKMFM